MLGLGNELMADDGVGIHAIRRLHAVLPAEVRCAEIGTATLMAEAVCEQADVVLAIDAVQADGPPGSVYVLDIEDVAMPGTDSLHSFSLAGLIHLVPSDKRPRVVVVGVEPACLEYSLALSEAVETALPRVVRVVCEIVASGRRLAPAMAVLGRSPAEAAIVEENP